MATTLFEKYGGFKAVSKIVMDFYDAALDSDQIGDYFADIDMPRLIDHQTKFVASLMGGPAAFSDERLDIVHRTLTISDADFDEMAALLGDVLKDHNVTSSDIAAILGEIESKRRVIVNRAPV